MIKNNVLVLYACTALIVICIGCDAELRSPVVLKDGTAQAQEVKPKPKTEEPVLQDSMRQFPTFSMPTDDRRWLVYNAAIGLCQGDWECAGHLYRCTGQKDMSFSNNAMPIMEACRKEYKTKEVTKPKEAEEKKP